MYARACVHMCVYMCAPSPACAWLSSQHQPGQLGLGEEQPTDQAHVLSSAVETTVCTVTLEKSSAGLGFSLEGGKGSLHGDKPLTINRIFKGGPLPFSLYIFSSCGQAANTPNLELLRTFRAMMVSHTL